MRHPTVLCTAVVLAAALSACGSDRTFVRRETVRTVPAEPAVLERQTTIQTIPADPVVVERKTTVERSTIER
jgi:hypothetical protein